MKLSGDVEVSNRLVPSLNLGRRRPERSHLSIGIFPTTNNTPHPFILLQTLKNGAGVKYKVTGNIETVFTRFVSEGKATIRFTEPPHDLIIKSSPQELKGFLQVLRHCLNGSADLAKPKLFNLSNLAAVPTRVQSKPKTKLVVSVKKDYPQLQGFPRTLEILQLNNIELKKLDGRILRLQNLRVLNLENNCLEVLPRELDLLPNLCELHLASNNFGSPAANWSWLLGTNIRRKLQLLDLSFNELFYLPSQLVKLAALKALYVQNNLIKNLPNGIGLLSNLQVLYAGNNAIKLWPGSFRLLRLQTIDISSNPSPEIVDEEEEEENMAENRVVGGDAEMSPAINSTGRPKTLLDICAQQVLVNRIHFTEETIPRTLSEQLEDACYCDCGKPTFPGRAEAFLRFDMKRISISVTYSHHNSPAYIQLRYCSNQCRQNRPSRGVHFL